MALVLPCKCAGARKSPNAVRCWVSLSFPTGGRPTAGWILGPRVPTGRPAMPCPSVNSGPFAPKGDSNRPGHLVDGVAGFPLLGCCRTTDLRLPAPVDQVAL